MFHAISFVTLTRKFVTLLNAIINLTYDFKCLYFNTFLYSGINIFYELKTWKFVSTTSDIYFTQFLCNFSELNIAVKWELYIRHLLYIYVELGLLLTYDQ